jgi:hypothetical protein
VIDRLEADHDYLTEGGVFTSDLIETWDGRVVLDGRRARDADLAPGAAGNLGRVAGQDGNRAAPNRAEPQQSDPYRFHSSSSSRFLTA